MRVTGDGRTGDRLAANIALHLLAQAALASGEFVRAAGYFRDALGITFEASDRPNAAFCLQGLAAVAEAHDEPARAARLLGAAESLLESAGGPATPRWTKSSTNAWRTPPASASGNRRRRRSTTRDARCPSKRPSLSSLKKTRRPRSSSPALEHL